MSCHARGTFVCSSATCHDGTAVGVLDNCVTGPDSVQHWRTGSGVCTRITHPLRLLRQKFAQSRLANPLFALYHNMSLILLPLHY